MKKKLALLFLLILFAVGAIFADVRWAKVGSDDPNWLCSGNDGKCITNRPPPT